VSAPHGFRQPTIAARVTLVALGLIAGCRGDDAGAGAHPRASDPVSADRRAEERANRMLDQARRCEQGAAADRPAACQAACELGHSNSCHGAGVLREAAGDAAAAVPLYTRACDGGSGLGCEAAARARRAGLTGPPDPTGADRLDQRARFYLRVHCEQGHATSCLVLGRLYTTSRGGPADGGSAATFRRRACALGLAAACAAPPAF